MSSASAIPNVITDFFKKDSGLILLCGNKDSGVGRLLKSIIELNDLDDKKALIVSNYEPVLNSKNWIVSPTDEMLDLDPKKVRPLKRVMFESLTKLSELELALDFAEDGRQVIMHMTTNSFVSSLHKISYLLPLGKEKNFMWRFLDQLHLSYSQIKAVGEKSERVPVGEIIPINPEIRKSLYVHGVDFFEANLKSMLPDSGVITFNQSLLQLLIRRKISLASAFELSRDPSDLDSLLKKVGI